MYRKNILPIVLEMKILFSFIFISLFYSNYVWAQQTFQNEAIIPLTIGDNIPEVLWNAPLNVINHPQGKEVINLDDYRGKLIILDFWGTYCSSCIAAFPHVKVVQDKYPENLKVLAISPEKQERLASFFNNEIGKKYNYINSVFEDTVLNQYFPHRGVPHLIWISPSGKYISPTNTLELTIENVEAVLDNSKIDLRAKIDIDQKKPLFLSDKFDDKLKLKFYSIFFQGYYPGLPSGNNFKRNTEGKVYGRQMTNSSLMDIIQAMAYEIFKSKNEIFNEKRIVKEITNPSFSKLKLSTENFDSDEYYSYELIVPEKKSDSLYNFMLNDLNRYLDFNILIENRVVECFVVTNKTKVNNEAYQSDSQLSPNNSLKDLLAIINAMPLTDYPIIDETGSNHSIEINPSKIRNMQQLKIELNKYGIELNHSKRNLMMLVLNDK